MASAAQKQRSAAKGWATRSCNRLMEICSRSVVDKPELKDAIDDFDVRIAKLDEVQAMVEVELTTFADIEADIEEAEKYRVELRRHRLAAAKLFEQLCRMDTGPDDQSSHVSSRVSQNPLQNSTAKLPKLVLPTFSGEPTQWQGFWNQFTAVIRNSDLADITKFSYLLSLLEGDAKAAVQGLSLSSDHYSIACDILQQRFGRPGKIIFSHVQELLNLSVAKSNNVPVLWKMYNELQSHVRSLEALNITGSQYGVILTPLVLSRLPSDIRLEWAREGEGRENDLKFLLDFLYKEIQSRERSQVYNQVDVKATVTRQVNAEKPAGGSASALTAASSAPSSSNRRPVCNVCDYYHPTDKCFKLTKIPMSDRRDCMSKHGLCFRCLSKKHLARVCKAFCSSCGGRHHVLLCDPNRRIGGKGENDSEALVRSNESDNVKHEMKSQTGVSKQNHSNVTLDVANAVSVSPATVSSTLNVIPGKEQGVILQTAEIEFFGSKGRVKATALFDTGSDKTYISSKLVSSVCPAWVRSEPIRFTAFGSAKTNDALRNVFHVYLNGLEGIESVEATEIPVVCAPLYQRQVSKSIMEKLSGLVFASNYNEGKSVEVDLLIGLDNYWRFMTPGVRILSDGLVAQNTKFGWILSGSCESSASAQLNVSSQLLTVTDLPDTVLRNFWDIESIGILPESDNTSLASDLVLQKFTETINFSKGRYEVALPWKDNCDRLQNNESIAHRRLMNLTNKLNKDPLLKAGYHEAISQLAKENIIEEVPEEVKSKPSSGLIFYLPHRPVVKESSSTTKIRPVFDASAPGYNGICLNDCLDIGPSLLPTLVDILLRFRRWPVALSADITKAFLQISVQVQDRDVHRFLWNDNGIIKTMRFLRVPFGNCSSPFLLNATVRHHLSKYPDSPTVKELRENLYVDDWLTGADSEQEACELFQEAYNIMQEANMQLAKYNTNNDTVSLMFRELDCKYSEIQSTKVLGLQWCTESDSFGFAGLDMPSGLIVTKRVILSFLARMYDPLGLITPYLIATKIILQDVWSLGLDWDQEVPEEIGRRFTQWVHGLKLIWDWKIPRCYTTVGWKSLMNIEIHGFGDASEHGYGAVVYLRVTLASGEHQVSLIIAKGRVAPLKKITLPRLELLAALLTSRLVVHVTKALQLPNVKQVCYSDSTVVLSWIKGNPLRWKTFVANRVIEIQQLTTPLSWNHCESVDNPADLISRGVMAETLVNSKIWLAGPEWLKVTGKSPSNAFDQGNEEEKPLTASLLQKIEFDVIDVGRYSSLVKAIRVVAWINRFIANLRHGTGQKTSGDLCYDELTKAKLGLLQIVQQQSYEREISALKKGQVVSAASSIAKLNPFLDQNGLLRAQGRLQFSELAYEEKHPIILPKGYFSLLLVRFHHEIMHHVGVANLITRIRSEYWIVGLRQTAKRVKRTCVSCQRQDSQFVAQPIPPLPELRVKRAPPFAVTGIDHAGPLYCCDSGSKKFYILLFTCAVVRAVHLELVESLSLKDTVLAIRRFAARRGMPSVIFSDNARSFKAAEKQMLLSFGPLSPKWKYIAPLSPWWGGWWERMVRIVKSALRKSIGRQSLTRTELETTLHEVESCINSRPLTFVADNISDRNPLTPSHFLIGRCASYSLEEEDSLVAQPADLVDRIDIRETLLNKFWSIWSSEYIRNLPLIKSGKTKGNLKVGSLVIIQEENRPRLQWPMGIVTKLYQGRDEVVRAVDIKTAKGVFTRPIQRLHELELAIEAEVSTEEMHIESDSNQESVARVDNQSDDKSPIKDNKVSRMNTQIQTNETVPIRVSRYGRPSIPPKKLNL